MNKQLAFCFRSYLLVSIFMLFSPAAWAHCGGNHGENHPHCNGGGTGGGDQDPVYTAEATDPFIPSVDSYSADSGDRITFRQASIDLEQFEGTLPDGTTCNHGEPTGTMSTRRKSNQEPDIAVVRFGFSALLDNGQEAHHVFIMEGVFDEPLNYPPTESDPETTLTLDYWEVGAEQRKAQSSDCAGYGYSTGGPDPIGPWTVTVTLQPEP